nr:sensor domain-containing diguanylate cyclase [uncultured Desulfobacter sp.]
MDDINRMEARVKQREYGSYISIPITNKNKPEIHEYIIQKWQDLIDICSRIMRVPSGLIMKLHKEKIEVFLRSDTKGNPYKSGETENLGLGLYCETVVAKKETLLIPDAKKTKVWQDNPDIKLNMISYLGMPLLWPDEEIFGTICILDNKENHYSQDFIDLLLTFRRAIESDLSLLVAYKDMYALAHVDQLTKLANRRSLDNSIKSEFNRSTRYGTTFSLILFDIDNFKNINDTYGHPIGDKVLVDIAGITNERLRSSDVSGRWGGEEFLIICAETELEGATALAENIRQVIEIHQFPVVGNATCSFGVSSYKKTDKYPEDVIKRADERMYMAKQNGKNMVF